MNATSSAIAANEVLTSGYFWLGSLSAAQRSFEEWTEYRDRVKNSRLGGEWKKYDA
jgi:hypothetical protein